MSATPGADPEARLDHAVGLALRHLGRRDRTVAEVRAHLERRGIEEPVLGAALDRLAEMGYLDDAAFARRFAEDRRALDGWGGERIARRLRDLGIDRDLADAAAAAEDGRPGELATALGVLERRFPSPPEEPAARRRALGVLVRKGYDPELAADAIRAHRRGGLDA